MRYSTHFCQNGKFEIRPVFPGVSPELLSSYAGFIKRVHKKDGTLLGATIVASRAGEMIHEWIVALHQRIKVGDLSTAIHVYPSYSVAGQQAAATIRIDRLLSGTSGRVVRGLTHLMRRVGRPRKAVSSSGRRCPGAQITDQIGPRGRSPS